ncbi:hypothetical protein [Aquimarina sp. 2201CG14-23]|uniref:hypothetical protein n=1 Tax=Aquimarina mycalae TaxID=3040073 RepID=UPI00247828DA|nr:hypothetical protein [Aquimarina sp. 2201CG14-23]MDH7446965.1 hypothetical protein [Aquimarina sp. 2201CG14-23]
MKTDKLILIVCIVFMLGCSTDKNEVYIESNNLKTTLVPINTFNTMTKNIRFDQDYCGQQQFTVYWNRNAQEDFARREQIRQEFYRDHGLDEVLGIFPESVEKDYEVWFFFLGEDNYPCHTSGVMAKINHEGNGEVSTDDD